MAGYSGTPLVKKLGLKEGHTVFIHDAPDEYFDWLYPIPNNVVVQEKLTTHIDFIHLFVTDQKTFQKLLSNARTS